MEVTVNSILAGHNGTGAESTGCEWPSFIADSIPGGVNDTGDQGGGNRNEHPLSVQEEDR